MIRSVVRYVRCNGQLSLTYPLKLAKFCFHLQDSLTATWGCYQLTCNGVLQGSLIKFCLPQQVSLTPTWWCISSPVTVCLRVSVSAVRDSPTAWFTPISSSGMYFSKTDVLILYMIRKCDSNCLRISHFISFCTYVYQHQPNMYTSFVNPTTCYEFTFNMFRPV